jgi:hypothetical protein
MNRTRRTVADLRALRGAVEIADEELAAFLRTLP